MHDLKLYGHYDSGHVYKVALFLGLANISYQYEHVNIWIDKSMRQPDFLDASRNAEVPCLIVDGKPYIQSNLILHKLARLYGLFGGESEQRLLTALDWQFWEANRMGMCLPQLRYASRFAPEEFTPGGLAFLKQRFDADIATLATHLDDGREFVLDDAPSIADISLCGYLYWADEAGVELPGPVEQWLGRISKMDGWQRPYELLNRIRYEKPGNNNL